MKYDYTFFQKHASRCRMLQCQAVACISPSLNEFFSTEREAMKNYDVVIPMDETTFAPAVVRCSGAYFKGKTDVSALEDSLQTELPEDFKQFYEQFGETVIITRSKPISIYPLQTMIEAFEDDPDVDILEGRFFRFAHYQEPYYLGLRRNDITNEWQVVACTYGLLYSEMIGPQGRTTVVAPSFYEWLKHLIDTDGFPDEINPPGPHTEYLTVIEE
jgi:hypothetical protein